jgi:hypothetical protein
MNVNAYHAVAKSGELYASDGVIKAYCMLNKAAMLANAEQH